jgi:hypothetical protein
MRYVMRSEFGYPFFNGYFTGINVVIGPGGFVDTKDNFQKQYQVVNPLTSAATLDLTRRTV